MIRLFRPFPFTILMLAVLISAAVWTRSHVDPLAPSIRRALGFAPLHLPRGEWGRLFSSVFFTVGGVNFYASAIMLAGSLGATEIVTIPDHGRAISADLSHLIAFPLGVLAAGWLTPAAPLSL